MFHDTFIVSCIRDSWGFSTMTIQQLPEMRGPQEPEKRRQNRYEDLPCFFTAYGNGKVGEFGVNLWWLSGNSKTM